MLLLAIKALKMLAVLALFAGTVIAIAPGPLARRRVAAFAVAGPAFGLTWALGLVLTGVAQYSYLSPWILGALLSSFVALQVVLWAAGREGRDGWGALSLALGLHVATVALMVFRPA